MPQLLGIERLARAGVIGTPVIAVRVDRLSEELIEDAAELRNRHTCRYGELGQHVHLVAFRL